ncbi:MAG: hypothetical protein WCF68_17045 [Terriglobales bacterium]
MMRFPLAVAILVASVGVSGLAQQSTFKVKHTPDKTVKSTVPVVKTGGTAPASTASSKDLRNLEHQTAKSSAPHRSPGQKTAPALKPVKDKPNPPMNFGGTGGGKSTGTVNQGANSYKGRLKQKHARQ